MLIVILLCRCKVLGLVVVVVGWRVRELAGEDNTYLLVVYCAGKPAAFREVTDALRERREAITGALWRLNAARGAF